MGKDESETKTAPARSRRDWPAILTQSKGSLLNKRTARKIIQELLYRSGNEVPVRLHYRFPGKRMVGGKYSMSDRSVTMYLGEVKKQSRLLFGSAACWRPLFAIVFAHELGHASDPELPALCSRLDACEDELERSRTALRIEENAWDYARRLIPEIDPRMLERVMDDSLLAYRQAAARHVEARAVTEG